MPKEKIIALYADSYNEKTGQSNTYLNYFSRFGQVILIHASMDADFVLKHADILALPGGADVDPRRYLERGEFISPWTGRLNTHYEDLDQRILLAWIATGKPIIGICRGMQSLNVALGGSLHQHIIDHAADPDEDRKEALHDIYTDINGFEIYPVNSFHHQGLRRIADGLQVLGWASVFKGCPSVYRAEYENYKKIVSNKRHGEIIRSNKKFLMVPEIVRHVSKPYIAFQYHPEEFNCILADTLINDTLNKYYVAEEATKTQSTN